MAIFSLQDDPADSYQDNPFHYLVGAVPDTGSSATTESSDFSAASRYPPELFHTFYTKSGDAARPLGSATDIWALGQVMWCLLTNLEHGGDFRPRWENEGGGSAEGISRVFINDGEKYGREDLEERVFGEDTVAGGYSAVLKGVVRDCLNWDPWDRPGLEELKRRIEGAVELKGTRELLVRVPGDVERWLVGGKWSGEVVQ
ncbi:hypothetical protein LEMA_P102020.1 [Plenodomus lingam JN3]|uniref:Protein kinase domain-containing protein n=2 Tax=Leptosphaeria maculans TaxID=5022 RepID=E5A0L1_LEPMJ|nr:hypothetical protein LEMA_P102020.1 [Plenodomus lingam JN3]CBX97071.1 hypothetical protein LEMA_P102020.1 [Plenodomus lingam JN3]